MSETVATGGQAGGSVSDAPTHLADNATEAIDTEITLMHNSEDMLRAIDEALARLDEGTFGLCERCQRPIATERLEAIPYTPHCINCARELQELL